MVLDMHENEVEKLSGNYSQFTPVGVSCAKELTAHYSNLRGRLVDLLCTNDAESH